MGKEYLDEHVKDLLKNTIGLNIEGIVVILKLDGKKTQMGVFLVEDLDYPVVDKGGQGVDRGDFDAVIKKRSITMKKLFLLKRRWNKAGLAYRSVLEDLL